MPEPRELRSLAIVELIAVLVLAALPPSQRVPIGLPLLLVGSLSRWIRRRSWGEVLRGGLWPAAVGALVGAIALGLAVVAGTPLVEGLSARAVEWSAFPLARGNAETLAIFALYVGVNALAIELALRGWLVERLLELSPGPPILPVLVGAAAEALITDGGAAARFGAAMFGAGLGWMYVAGGRSAVAPVCARIVFAVGALLLEALRVVG